MCIFANGVGAVADTRIAAFTRGNECFTAYQMNVSLGGKPNAMILPVPTAGAVRLVDMSARPKFFEALARLWPTSRSMTLSLSATASILAVEQVGSYAVSVAPTVADINRIDPSVFQLSPFTEEVLRADYPAEEDFAFVVAKLTDEGKKHPLAYIYEPVDPRALFLPTRHVHGGPHRGANWDHRVYVQGPERLLDDPEARGSELRVSPAEAGRRARTVAAILETVPELDGFLDPGRPLSRAEWWGPLRNIDARFAVSTA